MRSIIFIAEKLVENRIAQSIGTEVEQESVGHGQLIYSKCVGEFIPFILHTHFAIFA